MDYHTAMCQHGQLLRDNQQRVSIEMMMVAARYSAAAGSEKSIGAVEAAAAAAVVVVNYDCDCCHAAHQLVVLRQ